MSSQRSSHKTLKSIEEKLILYKEIFITTRNCTLEELRETADVMEGQMKASGIGKVTGAALAAVGSLGIGATGLAATTGVVVGAVAAPVLVVGSAVATTGALTTAGAEFFKIRKSRRHRAHIEGALMEERRDMEMLATDMERLPLPGSLPREALEAANVLKNSLALAALGISCSPEKVAQRADLINKVVRGGAGGFSRASEADVISKGTKLRIPGFTELTHEGGLQFAVEEGGAHVLDLVTGGVAAAKAFMLPVFVYKLVKRSTELRRGSHRDGANILRQAAEKLESDGSKWVERQEELIESAAYQCRCAAKREKQQRGASSLRHRLRRLFNDDSSDDAGDDSSDDAGDDSSDDAGREPSDDAHEDTSDDGGDECSDYSRGDSLENFFRRYFGL